MKAKSIVALASCLAISFFATEPAQAADAANTSSAQTARAADAGFRLPKNVAPELYTLEFIPDLKNFTFKCFESIDLSVKEPTDTIVLNALDLNISSA